MGENRERKREMGRNRGEEKDKRELIEIDNNSHSAFQFT